MSILWIIESSAPDRLTGHSNRSDPLIAIFSKMNAHQSGLVVRARPALVLHVDLCGRVAQIVDSVIKFVSVNVVNIVGRPNAVNVKPRKTVAGVGATVGHQVVVPILIDRTSNIASAASALVVRASSEDARRRVKVQKLAQTRVANLVHP